MVNNEFHIIGTALTNFEALHEGTFSSYLLRVEVEKMGSKKGNNFELTVQVYATNNAVDVKNSVVGQLIAVNGFLDSYVTEKGALLLKAVAQNVVVLSKKNFDKFVVDDNIEVD